MLLPNLTPDDVRLDPLDNGVKPVWWQRVDPYLSTCTQPGDVTRLGRKLGIAIGTLLARRRVLKLGPLPTGRPKVSKLTKLQRQVQRYMDKGLNMTEIANEMGLSRSTVREHRDAVLAKYERQCKTCDGTGVVPCPHKCFSSKNHFHICEECKGDGHHD